MCIKPIHHQLNSLKWTKFLNSSLNKQSANSPIFPETAGRLEPRWWQEWREEQRDSRSQHPAATATKEQRRYIIDYSVQDHC